MSKVHMPLQQQSSNAPKLPLIADRTSLVSPSQSIKSNATEQQAAAWARDIRDRLERKLAESTEVTEDEVNTLRHELIALFITALQKDDRKSWKLLWEALHLVLPYKDFLGDQHEIYHYLERINHHLHIHKERLFDLHIRDALKKVFPEQLEDIERRGAKPAKLYCPPTPPRSSTGLPSRKPTVKFLLPDGKDPYEIEHPDDKDRLKPKLMTFGDLRASFPNVALEMATREAIWSACLGTTALALNTDLPEEPQEGSPRKSCEPAAEEFDIGTEENLGEEISMVSEEAEEQTDLPLDGREAVEYFGRCYHTGKIRAMYFNIAPNRHFKPYDLISVPKHKVNPEHYVFSTFGVLHVFPKAPNENMSLADWQKEAVLFQAVSRIPFFKHYLLKRMFERWRSNVHFAGFSEICQSVRSRLLQTIPSFGAALLQISQLCQELLHLKLLPLETNKCYMLIEFENSLNYINMQAEKTLARFFRYNKIVVDTTSQESFKKLRHCEQQVKQRPVFTKESLHLQRFKKEQRDDNLKKAKEEISRLGRFVKLVEQVLLAHLVKLACYSVTTFVYDIMQVGPNAPRDGLFRVNLVFGPEDTLKMSPAKETFVNVLNHTFSVVPTLLCEAVEPLDGSIENLQRTEQDRESPPGGARASENTPDKAKRSPRKQQLNVTSANKSNRTEMSRQSFASSASETTSGGRHSHRESTESDDSEIDREEDNTNMDADDLLNTPNLTRQATPTKSADHYGQATPRLVSPGGMQDQMVVVGRFVVGQCKPLTVGNLQEKLNNDEAYIEALNVQEAMMEEAIEEIDTYCEKNSWLNEIYVFCKTWNEDSLQKWKGAAAFNIEQQLNELRQWSERVRNFDKSYTTENGIFCLDCCGVQQRLIPKLTTIIKELCTSIADDASIHGKKFCDEMKIVLQNMTNKETSIGGFAVYAKNVTKYKKNTGHFQQRMEYIKALFEVIRMSYRPLTAEEEKLEEGVMASWEAFLFQIQDAMEFVNTQTPLITQNLDDTYQRLEEEATQVCTMATTGKFLDPSENPTTILIDMRRLREHFYDIRQQMQQASKWKDAITGEPHDLSILNQMAVQMDIRHELWKYVEVSTHTIREWKTLLFNKLNTKKCLDKLNEWQSAAGQLKPHLPPGDEVLAHWFRMLSDFRQDLPLLHKLSNDALKTRHWKTIFVTMGEQLEPDHQFSVEELLSYNLGSHSQIVNTVYSAAVAEFTIEEKLVRVRRLWEEWHFKLAKHIPDSMYKCEDNPTPPVRSPTSGPRKLKRYEKFRYEKSQLNPQKSLQLRSQELYVLIEVEDLKYMLQDSQVTLKTMLTSPYLADHRAEAEYWAESLAQIEEITDLWMNCQKKWLFLLKVFDEPEVFRKMERQGAKFESVHTKFVEIMQTVVADSKVTSILNKGRGEKGYRVLQGDKLRNLFISLIASQEAILKELGDILDRARSQFPRLYFLSDQDIVEMLAISRNPKSLEPFARKCFSGVESLEYSLPTEIAGLNSSLDYDLNAHKLEVTKLRGALGEELPLYARVEVQPQATKWLSLLEQYMKTTVHTVMEDCVQTRLEEGSKQPIQLLEELSKCVQVPDKEKKEAEELAKEIKLAFSHWLLRFPAQCVLTAEAIMWERSVFKALEKQDTEELKAQRSFLVARLDQYIKVLRDNCLSQTNTSIRRRLHCLLGCLVNQGLHHRDVTDCLLENSNNLSDGAYDWLKVLKYHMEIRTVLRAKTDSDYDKASDSSQPTASSKPSRRSSVVRVVRDHRSRTSFDDLDNRSMTTVSTGYQFGSCVVSQMGENFIYNCEYIGPAYRLAFTPLTERAYLTLSRALSTFTCGTLIGPPGSGKSETVKDLAKAFGRHMVTFNCGENFALPQMNQFLNGMVQSGCWALFDDTDRMTQGLMSVFAQQLEYLSNALRVLAASSQHQYGIRGQPRFDKQGVRIFYDLEGKKTATKSGEKKIRRNSLTTLHSLPATYQPHVSLDLQRQRTVPNGFNEQGLCTYFAENWVRERDRRQSIEKEIGIKDSLLYKSMRPPPLFLESVTRRRQPKQDFKDLVPQFVPYRPTYLGNVLVNGKLVKANANYGCFMTVNTTNPDACYIPHNMRLCMRSCALVVPDLLVISEIYLCCNGYQQYKSLSAKLKIFFDLIKMQLPRHEQYDFGLKTLTTILKLADKRRQQDQREQPTSQSGDPNIHSTPEHTPSLTDSGTFEYGEEDSLIHAIAAVLLPQMTNSKDLSRMRNLIRDVFPSSARPKSGAQRYNPKLISAVEEQLRQDNLQPTADFVDKILQLYSAIQLQQGVILSGPSGSGKSTCYQTLSKVLTRLCSGRAEIINEDFTSERSLAFQCTQKLKILKESEPRPKATAEQKIWQKLGTVQSIASLLQNMVEDEGHDLFCPKVDLEVIFPNVLTPQELLGEFEEGQWRGGLLSQILHNSQFQAESAKVVIKNSEEKKNRAQIEVPTSINKWLVLDGAINSAWVDDLNTLLDDQHCLSLASGDTVRLQENTSVIFELTDLEQASPSAISRCSIVHCANAVIPWKSLIESWAHTAKHRWILNSASLQVLSSLANSTFSASLTFLNTECCPALLHNVGPSIRVSQSVSTGMHEVASYLNILSAILDKNFLREEFEKIMGDWSSMPKPDEEDELKSSGLNGTKGTRSGRLSSIAQLESSIPNYMTIIRNIFAFSYIWGFGGGIADSCVEKFDEFARETLRRASQPIHLPDGGTVFDYFVDCKIGSFLKWGERQLEKTRNLPPTYTVIPEVDRYNFLVDLLLSTNQPVLITGDPGVGKSSLIENLVHGKHAFTKISMSAGFTSTMLQEVMVARVTDLRQRSSDALWSYGANKSKLNQLYFVEDLNTAEPDGATGYAASLELLRQVLTQHCLYDRQRHVATSMADINVLAACTSPAASGAGCGYACHVMSSRLTRLFITFNMFAPDDHLLHSIYTKTVQSWLEEFPTYSVQHHFEFAKAIVQSVIELYKLVKEKLRPTPANAHYVLSLHDIAHTLEGILLMSPRSKVKPKSKKKIESRGGSPTWGSSRATSAEGTRQVPPMMRAITRLWCHECTRSFGDRIILEEDQRWFESALEDVVVRNFCTGTNDLQEQMSTIREDSLSQVGSGTPFPARGDSISASSETPSTPAREDESSSLSGPDTNSPATPVIKGRKSRETMDSPSGTSPEESKTAMSATGRSSQRMAAKASMKSATPNALGNSPEGASQVHEADEADSTGSIDSQETADVETVSMVTADVTHSVGTSAAVGKHRKTQRQNSPEKDTPSTFDSRTGSASTTDTSRQNKDSITPSTRGRTTEEMKSKSPVSQPSVKTTSTTSLKRTVSRPVAGVRRGVSFKVGLIADREQQSYTGALLSMEHIRDPDERLTDFIFTKYILSTHAEAYRIQTEKGYSESSEERLGEALRTCLALYNRDNSRKLELVFFREAVYHAARLSKVMATPGGHAMLLSLGYATGRATMVRLAAYFSNCKLFEPKLEKDGREGVREHMKRCSRSAAFHGKQVVLLVQEDQGLDCLNDVCAFMKEGTCPGLYSSEEVQNIATQMTPGQVKTTRVDKVEAAFGKFLQRVKQNLHVIVCINYNSSGSGSSSVDIQSKLSRFPALLTQTCHIDLYRPLSHEAYVSVAEFWLMDPNSQVLVPWNEHSKLEQLSLVATAMAYIHTSAQGAVEKLNSHQRLHYKIFTPLTFLEFVDIFKVVAAYVGKTEMVKKKKFDLGLARMDEAYETIKTYKREVSELVPDHKRALGEVKEHALMVEMQREQYREARERCRVEEEKIERMMSPLENLRLQAQAEFDKVNPTYHAALSALKSLDPRSVDEIKSYRVPPPGVMKVMNAICLLFREPKNWETAKQLLIKDNFFHELEFYDKDNIPDDIFEDLGQYFSDSQFTMDYMRMVSLAASFLCQWVHAVYKYAEICRNMKPKIQELLDAEERVNKAQGILGSKRVEANRVKSSLEERIDVHQQASKKAKAMEKQMQNIEKRISKANKMVDNMSGPHSVWKSDLKVTRSKIRTAPGDALLTAACICYHGPLDNHTRAELMTDWLNRCEQGNFDPCLRGSRQIKPIPLSAKLETLMRVPQSITDSIHSIHQGDPSECASHRGDDVLSLHETERASSASSMPQMSVYKHNPSIYDTGMSFRTEIRVLDNIEGFPGLDSESIDASSVSSKNLLAVRENFTLQDVLSTFEELSQWKLNGLPTDVYSIHNALIMRVACNNRKHCWPLLVDPNGQSEMWVRAMQTSPNAIRESEITRQYVIGFNMHNAQSRARAIAHSHWLTTVTPGNNDSKQGNRTITLINGICVYLIMHWLPRQASLSEARKWQKNLFTLLKIKAPVVTNWKQGVMNESSTEKPEDRFYSRETTRTMSDFMSESCSTGLTSAGNSATERAAPVHEVQSQTTATRESVLESRHLLDSGEVLRGVSSVDEDRQKEMSNLKVEETIDRPEDNLWVMSADDSNLQVKLLNSIIHGVTVLITHLERKALGPLFEAVLLKEFQIDKEGRRVVFIGDEEFPCHPDFCLYLTTSMPLFLKGEGVAELPVQKVSIIDMSASQQGVIDTLLTDLLRLERPEFEGQSRSMESDLLRHQEILNKEQDAIMKKTLDLREPLLDDRTMLDALLDSQRNLDQNSGIMEETHYLRQHLDEKRVGYDSVATNGARLYEMVQRVSVLNPLYHIPLSTFVQLFAKAVESRQRGKGNTGAAKAREQELINATTQAVLRFVSTMMFEQHMQLFSFLVTLERLRMSQQLTNQELGLFVNGVDTSEIEDTIVFDDKPDWVTNKVWLDCAALEATLVAFRGLRDSFMKHNAQWREYFKCPVVLINPLPGERLQQLSVFQKCLLWRICCPRRLWEVSESLIQYELGSVMESPETFDIRSVYDFCDKSTPVVLIMPSNQCDPSGPKSTTGHVLSSPVHEIQQLGKDTGMEGRVHVVTCGVNSQMQELQHALQDCMQSGYWLVLQNAHLAQPWTPSMLHLLRVMQASKGCLGKPDTPAHSSAYSATEATEAVSTVTKSSSQLIDDIVVHSDFRLWVTTKADTGRLIPGILIQHGVKVSCEVPHNFKDIMRRSYFTVQKLTAIRDRASRVIKEKYDKMDPLLPLALLHSLLLYRRGFSTSAFSRPTCWSQGDLASLLDQFRVIWTLCRRHRGVTDVCDDIYGGYCVDICDRKTIQAVARSCLLSPTDLEKLPKCSLGAAWLLDALMPCEGSTIDEKLDALPDVCGSLVNLPASADLELIQTRSRNLLQDLVGVIGAPDILTTPRDVSNRKAEMILQEAQKTLQNLPDLPSTNPDAFYPLDMFFHAEVDIWQQLVAFLVAEVNYLLQVARGEVSSTPHSQEALHTISKQRVPQSWTTQGFPSCVPVTQWLAGLRRRLQLLTSYIEQGDQVVSYNLAAFHRPDRFVQSVLQNFVRREFKDMHSCKLDVQFVPVDMVARVAPPSGVYLSGLMLYNASWDPSEGCLVDARNTQPSTMPLLWLKPQDKFTLQQIENKLTGRQPLYDCPIYSSAGSHCLQSSNIVASLEIPSSQPPVLWQERRVYMCSSL